MSNELFLKIPLLFSLHGAQQGNFLLITGKFIGGFQNHGLVLQPRMIHNGPEGIQSQTSLTQTFMPVLMAGEGILAVVDMNRLQLFQSDDPVKLKLRSLDNAEVFFDVPLYFGLFGTVSAFLVMTFSPQSSRLIAYSSTLIGIIFSLLLRLTMYFPLKNRLLGVADKEEVDK